MDNLHARMGAPAHDEPKNVSQEAPRYISPHPPVAVSEQKKNKDKKPRPKWLVVLVVVSVIAAVSLGVAKMVLNGGMDGINRDRYQAVFLADDSAGVSVLSNLRFLNLRDLKSESLPASNEINQLIITTYLRGV